jgi:hypothetical protein
MSSVTTTVDLGLDESGLTHGCVECSGRAAGCGCSGNGAGDCGCSEGTLERPRWFAGQLVGPADLEAVQTWVLTRSRRHNRLLHGWGVVCGLTVNATTSMVTGESEPWSVTVGAGLALSGCGDEVSVPCAVRLDIRQPQPSGSDTCAPPVDPWCAPVRQRRDPARTYYLAVRYAEESRRPVRSGGCGCGCDGDPCEYSRIGETAAIAVLSELPDCYTDVEDRYEVAAKGGNLGTRGSALGCSPEIRELGSRPCPRCCSPWVVLADLRVSADGSVEVDPLAHRRFVAALPGLAFSCAPAIENVEAMALTGAVRSTIATAFAPAAAEIAHTGDAEIILAQPATLLRGGRGSTAVREVLGDLSVADLAQSDAAGLRRLAVEHKADADVVSRLHELAKVVTRLTQ